MNQKRIGPFFELLEDRTLFSLPFGNPVTSFITLNPLHSQSLTNIVSGPLLSADFNNDGKTDLVFSGRTNMDGAGTHYLGVMLGSANGTFTDAGTMTATLSSAGGSVEEPISSYAVGDFNGDGKQDLAAIFALQNGDAFNYELLVGFGKGDGTFTVQPTLNFDSTTFIPSDDTFPAAGIAVAKFAEGNDDQMAVVIPTDSDTEVLDILGLDGTNQFAKLNQTTLSGFSGDDDQIVAGRFDSESFPDVTVYDPIASKAVVVASNNNDDFLTDPTFSLTPPPANAQNSVIAAGDLNHDSVSDLAFQQAASGNATNLDVLISGSGFEAPVPDVTPATGSRALDWLKIGDFEDNGLDEVTTRFGLFRVDLAGTLLYSGFGTFTDTTSNNVTVGDFNGDGAADLVSVVGTATDATTIEFLPGATFNTLSDVIIGLNDQSAKNSVGADVFAKFSATVNNTSAGTPTGTVDFYTIDPSDNHVVDLGTSTLSNGVATITPTDMPTGTQNVFAAYSGDTTFREGQSDDVTANYAGGGSAPVVSPLESAIVKANLPPAAIAGGKLNKSVTVSVKNTGSSLFVESTTIDLFASLDDTIDPSDTMVGTITKALKIQPSKTINVAISLKSLPASLSGRYIFLAETVENGIQTSVGLLGPSVTIAPPFVSLVPTISKPTVKPNGSSVTQITVTNTGNIPSTGTTQILLYGSSDGTVARGTLLLMLKSAIHFKPGVKVKIRLLANPLETQLGRESADYVVEVIDSTGGTQTASTEPLE